MNLETKQQAQARRRLKWYLRHKNEPGFMEKQREYLRRRRASLKHDPDFKKQKAEHDLRYRLKVRDSEEWRAKRNKFNIKYGASSQSALKWAANNPEKAKAHRQVCHAVRVGKLVPPNVCSKCGCLEIRRRDGRRGLHAHHPDYSKPLEVTWLCAFCHGNERRKYR